jgi:indole-3-glycerol phosphate synthase
VVQERRGREPINAVEARALAARPQGERFRARLADASRINVIAECKRRSPSRGVLRADYHPVALASAYEQAGAAALSILTEPTFFDGSLDHLARVRAEVTLPLLRKDFIVDRYQLLEARAAGADAILLIVAALSDAQLRDLHAEARALGLAALVEVHDPGEVERALAAGAEMIGVNNRNLRTLEVDTRASEAAASRIPADVVAVSESGLRTAADLVHLRALGFNAFLIGERFMTSADPAAALRDVLTTGGVAVGRAAQP